MIKNFLVEENLQRKIDVNDVAILPSVLNSVHELSILDATVQYVTGINSGFSVKLPNATLLSVGRKFEIINSSSAYISIVNGGGVTLGSNIGQDARVVLTLVNNSTVGGLWNVANVHADNEYEVSSQNTSTTVSGTYEVVDNMSIVVPETGVYHSVFNADTSNTNNGTTVYFSFFLNGVQIIESERRNTNNANVLRTVFLNKLVSVIGGQTLDVRWYRSANTQTVYNRTLTLLQRR